jgi:LPXTG-motif cell wall-anchored protein
MKKKIIFLTIFLIICLISTTIYGALSATTIASANKTTVNPGKQIVITVAVIDIDGTEVGVAGIETAIQYDTNIFETVAVSDITSTWTVENAVPSTLISVLTTTPVTQDTNIFTITMQVKSTASLGSTTITFNEPTIFNLSESITTTLNSINITIEEEQQENNTNTNTNTNVSNTNTNTNTNTNQSNTILPKTGQTTYIGISMIALVIVSSTIYAYKKIKEYNI